MRILHVVDSLNPGGMENGVVNIATRLLHRDTRVHIACLRERGAFANRLPEPDALTVLGKTSGFSAIAVLRLLRLIHQWQPDVVHTHNLGPLVYASLATAGGRSMPILHGEHGQIQSPERTPRRIMLRRAFYRACHTVHTVSASLLETLKLEDFKAKRMIAIINGVDCDRFQPSAERASARQFVGLPKDAQYVLGIVGRFVALKRHRLLLQSLETVMARSPALHLLVIGDDGPERDAIVQAMRAHPFANRIHWLGMRSDMDRCYQAMDLLVSSSEIEGMSNAILEAMATGVPVLANLACGNNEILRDGVDGFLRDLRDTDSLAVAISEAISDQARLTQLGAAARQHVLGHFSLDAMADTYWRTYQAIIRDTGGAA